jgi:hypothetical protein
VSRTHQTENSSRGRGEERREARELLGFVLFPAAWLCFCSDVLCFHVEKWKDKLQILAGCEQY